MSRWIDADALIEGIANKFYNEASTAEAFDMVNKVCDYITGAPSIDIVPKRGEWQYICRGKWMFRRCSCCEWTQTYDDSKYMGYRYNFCPNCGAKMDGERRE